MLERRVNINGGFQIWQLGHRFESPPTGQIFADMWRYHRLGEFAHTIERSTDCPTFEDAGYVVGQCVKLTCTKSLRDIPSDNLCALVYRGEGHEWARLWQQPATISFWVKSSVPGTYFSGIANGPEDLSCPVAYEIEAADTWEFKSVEIPPSMSDSWYFDSRVGYSLFFFLALGSDFQLGTAFNGAPGEWNNGYPGGDARQANAVAIDGATFQLASVQLEFGTATPFEQWRSDDELRRCQRYIEKSFHSDTAPPKGIRELMSGHAHYRPDIEKALQPRLIRPTVPKRIDPNIFVYAASNDGEPGQTRWFHVDDPMLTTLPPSDQLLWIADASLPAAGSNGA